MKLESNPRKKLSFFGQKIQKSSLKDVELNQIITKALAESDDNIDDENDFQYEDNNSLVRRTTDGEIIPDNIVTVLIENIWIEKNIKLTDKLILEDIGEIPEDNNDLVDDLTDNENEENEEYEENENISLIDYNNEKGVLDYDINDLYNEFISNDDK